MAASSRKTDIADLLESFLDDNEQDLSPNMFKALDDLAGSIDEKVSELEEELKDLENELAGANEVIKEYEGG